MLIQFGLEAYGLSLRGPGFRGIGRVKVS